MLAWQFVAGYALADFFLEARNHTRQIDVIRGNKRADQTQKREHNHGKCQEGQPDRGGFGIRVKSYHISVYRSLKVIQGITFSLEWFFDVAIEYDQENLAKELFDDISQILK